MVLRYMGTKRALAHHVLAVAQDLDCKRVADLFCGAGAVTAELARAGTPVWANDLSPFIGVMARARSLPGPGTADAGSKEAQRLMTAAMRRRAALRDQFARRISSEARLLNANEDQGLAGYLAEARHVGSSPTWARAARAAAKSKTSDRYQLVTRYFSAGFFSTGQAVDLDALRYAIDKRHPANPSGNTARDLWLTIWLETAGVVMNSPGHSAQYLKANSEQSAVRVRRQWDRDVFQVFVDVAAAFRPWGEPRWRARNLVTSQDTTSVVQGLAPSELRKRCDLAYLDPPYTKDQYSRFYHVYETMAAYDFPDSHGEGRAPSSRLTSDFCYASRIKETLTETVRALLAADVRVLLSYPSNGLLSGARGSALEVLQELGEVRLHWRIDHEHSRFSSTRGGSPSKSAVENLILVQPAG